MILKKKKIGSKGNIFSANIRKSVQNLHKIILNILSFQNILSVFYVFPVYFIKKSCKHDILHKMAILLHGQEFWQHRYKTRNDCSPTPLAKNRV